MTDLDAFLVAKSAAGLSPRTVEWYELFIRQFLDWADSARLPAKKPETVEGWLSTLRKRSVSPFTISGAYRALSVYYKWLQQRRGLRTSPIDAIQPPRVPRKRRPHVTAAQFKRLYAAIDGTSWLDHRDRAILLILFYSGLRANELLGLRVDDVDEERALLIVREGKGGRDRDVPYNPDVSAQLAAYLAIRPPCKSTRLFVAAGKRPGEAAGPLSYDGLSQVIRRRCKRAGLPRLGLHVFRHGYAMLFLNDGEMELGALSQTMGHSSVDLTRRYYADYATASLRQRYNAALGRIITGQTD